VVIHIYLAFKEGSDEILGGIVFEFYHVSSFGLISYFCVDPRYRKLQIGKRLIEIAEEELNYCSIQNCGKPCEAIVLEMSSPLRMIKKDSFSPEQRIRVFNNLGCSLVEFDYVQPPLDTDLEPDTSLVLICLNRENRTSIDGDRLAEFLEEFWETSCDNPKLSNYLIRSISYAKMKKQIPLRPLTLESIRDFEMNFLKNNHANKKPPYKSNL